MKPVTETDYRARIERVIRALSNEPEASHTLDELARIAHFSPFHFHRIYRAMVGESVIETARRLRLARAALLLATTDSPVTEVAMDSGYESVQTFSRAFRNLTNVSPREFRDRGMQLAQLVVGLRPIKRGGSSMQVEIVERGPIKAWTMRLRGALTPENFKDTYSRLWQWQIDHGIAGRTREAIGIFYGDSEGISRGPVEGSGWGGGGDNAFRYYAGVVWDEPLEADGGIEVLEVPGGKYASYRLIGSYHGIPAAFQRLYGEWLPKSGLVPDDRPALEIYRNNPFDTPANELITDLLIPLR
ncbi:MAG TPA: AraC family transcriptional regulator [Verrucomicrobiae bacterium]|nr:AraC family transcriptional regulator [Verrucomicrobiae bacterium]